MSKESEIIFRIKMDENNVPQAIAWDAQEVGEKSVCEALLISLWDPKEKNTLKIDLWTKHMTVDEMKMFTHQTLMSMADTFERATNEGEIAQEMRDFGLHLGEKMQLIKKSE